MALMWGKSGVMLYNDAYVPIAGGRHPLSLGSSVFETWPEVAEFNRSVFERVYAGQSLKYPDMEFGFDRNGPRERVFLDLNYSPVSDEAGEIQGVLAVLAETTQSHLAREELNQTNCKLEFLDELGRALADSRDADDILAVTTRMTAEHLGLSNCAYADMDEDGDGFTIRGNWHAGGSPSILGHYNLADFGVLAVRELNAGRPLILNDNALELPEHEARTFQTIGIAATICMPLVKEGRLTALMAIHDRAPRAWTDYDLAIIGEVTERSWAHVERVGVEAELRLLNETLEERVAQRTAQLHLAEEALRQSQKMEAVGQLTGGIAHDFNNMLTGIIGGLEIVQRRIEQGRTQDLGRFMEGARLAAERAAALTARLLAFSRRQSLDSRPTDINMLIDSLEELLKGSIKEKVDLAIMKAPSLPPALVDPNQLESAILNLAINARDAMPDGGTLSILTRRASPEDLQRGEAASLPVGSYLAIDVSDNGVGMSAATRDKVFEPFFTTKPVGQGTGLGLSMVYGFAHQSNGCVMIASTPSVGTCVTILLPVAQQEPVSPDPKIIDLNNGDGETVLVVEDDPAVRLLVCDLLEELGYSATDVATPQEAITLFSSAPRFDLLVSDVGLPGMNGRQLADIARQHDADLPILFLTGYAENATVRPDFLGENMDMLTKPFRVEDLSVKIREILGKRKLVRVLH